MTLFQVAFMTAGPFGRDASHPWFICETVLTSDGPRTRICNGRYKTEAEAWDVLKHKETESRSR